MYIWSWPLKLCMNQPLAPKEFAHLPENADKRQLIELISNSEEYKNVKNFRNQLDILVEFSKSTGNTKDKISQKELGELFNVSVDTFKYQLKKAKDEKNGLIGRNGHPYLTKDQDLELIKKWIEIHPHPPKLAAVKQFILETFGLPLCYRSLLKIFDRIGFKIAKGEALEADRYCADTKNIDFFYENLFAFFQTYQIPSQIVFNFDEEGHEAYTDAVKEFVVVPKTHEGKVTFPVSRKNDHTTFIACISASGEYMKPLIIIKRKTVDSQYLFVPLQDKVLIDSSESGYINAEIYDKWINTEFFPTLKEKRNLFAYDGPAVLLLDGWSSHITADLIKKCYENNVKMFFLPPHSSHETQPLDLLIFHLHKDKIRKLCDDTDGEVITDKILDLYSTFQSVANVKNIKSSFEASGAVYDISNSLFPIKHYSKDFATRLSCNNYNKQQKKDLKVKREGYKEKRINIEELWKIHLQKQVLK